MNTSLLVVVAMMLSCTTGCVFRSDSDADSIRKLDEVSEMESSTTVVSLGTWLDEEQRRLVLLNTANLYPGNSKTDEFWFDIAEQACQVAAFDGSNESLARLVDENGLVELGKTELESIVFLRIMIGSACPEYSA
ncbi:MAG: hypothetical protein AAF547_14795 [Actinomycetota bacterium]